jgi:hypothetical protein
MFGQRELQQSGGGAQAEVWLYTGTNPEATVAGVCRRLAVVGDDVEEETGEAVLQATAWEMAYRVGIGAGSSLRRSYGLGQKDTL